MGGGGCGRGGGSSGGVRAPCAGAPAEGEVRGAKNGLFCTSYLERGFVYAARWRLITVVHSSRKRAIAQDRRKRLWRAWFPGLASTASLVESGGEALFLRRICRLDSLQDRKSVV